MKNSLLALHFFLLLPAAQIHAAADMEEVPEISSYAWGFPIVTRSKASFYAIELPLEVNQSVSDPNLRDAGVYNAAGIPLTRVFRRTDDDVEETEHLEPLPTIPLYENTQQTAEEVQLLFEQEGDRTRLEFNTDAVPTAGEAAQPTAYIVDTRPLRQVIKRQAIEELEFSWNPVDSGFIGRIMIEGSNNLQNWSSVGSGAVADLRQNGASVLQSRVKLSSKTSHDYLRVRWEGMPADWKLSRIQGFYVTGRTRIVRHAITLEASGVDAEDGGKLFDLGGTPIVDRIRVVLPEPNTVIAATIYYWSERQQRWIQATSGSFHNIGDGENTIVSGSASISKIRTNRFKIVATSGRPNIAMQLEIGWRPDSLIFLAQGDGPFTLATGRAADAENNYPQQRLYSDRSIIGLATANGRVPETATLGPRYPLGGTASLQVTKAVNWRQISLWIGLLLGVAFVGFMAIRVIGDLKSE